MYLADLGKDNDIYYKPVTSSLVLTLEVFYDKLFLPTELFVYNGVDLE